MSPSWNESLTTDAWPSRQALIDALNSRAGQACVVLVTLACAGLVATRGLPLGMALLGGVIALPLLVASLLNMSFGLAMIIFGAFFFLGMKRFAPQVPFGIGIDVLLGVLLLSLLVAKKEDRDWSRMLNPITGFILAWLAYGVAQLFNPDATSRAAWMYTIRAVALMPLLYVVSIFAFRTRRSINAFLKLWIALAVIVAVDGFRQEIFGLAAFEMNWLREDETLYNLVFNWGRFRKFSFLAEPTTYGITLAYTAVLCFGLAAGPVSSARRIALLAAGILMSMALVFSGTRTAYVALPVGIAWLAAVTLDRRVLLGLGMAFAVLFVLVFGPFYHPHVLRIRSAFDPGANDSFRVRLENQEDIRPYIQSHPIGGGMGSTGIWGSRFSPGTRLAQFPPDSGYVRVAVEMGWVGLLLYTAMLLAILAQGIKAYFSIRDPFSKSAVAAMSCAMFALCVANYPQEAIMALPANVLFWLAAGAITRLRALDAAGG